MDNLRSAINSWLKYLKNSLGLSENTVNSYLSDLNQLILFLNEYNSSETDFNVLKSLTKNDIRAWFLQRKNNGECAKTIARGLSAVKSFIKFLTVQKEIESNNILTMRPPKTPKNLPRPLNISQINDIITSISDIKQTDWIIKRDKALLALIYSVGLRISEALNLNKCDISNTNDQITILGKGRKLRVVPIVKSIKEAIFDYLNNCKFKDAIPLFVSNHGKRLTASAVQKLVKKSRELLGFSEKVTPHALRHSCATHLMENSGDLRGIQELLGHASIASTQIYADVAKKYIATVYDQCHPLSQKHSSGKNK